MTHKKTLGWRQLDQLKPNRLQNVVVFDVDDEALDRLVADLRKNGQLQPIEITDDDEIIDGHQRKRAAEKLGWEKVRVWIRNDLADELAVKRRFLEANLNRRQMEKMEKARAYVALKDVERQDQDKTLGLTFFKTKPLLEARADLRDELARLFGCSGRTLDRYARLLNTPIEVQRAFEADQLSQKEAERVANCSESRQQEIAERIRAGEDARQVVAELAVKRERRKHWRAEMGRLFGQLETAVDVLRRKRADTKKYLRKSDLPTLKKVRKHVDGIIKYIEANPDKCKNIDEIIADAAARIEAIS